MQNEDLSKMRRLAKDMREQADATRRILEAEIERIETHNQDDDGYFGLYMILMFFVVVWSMWFIQPAT